MTELPPIRELWDYDDPKATELRMRDVLATATDYALELQTQIARTLGLQGEFDAAHALLDEVEPQSAERPRVRVCTLLERGRAFNSGGRKDEAPACFEAAWETAREVPELGRLALDAAHMLAIVGAPAEQIAWARKAIALAEAAEDPDVRGWLGPLHNNLGWTLHDEGDLAAAMVEFEASLKIREESGQQPQLRIAHYTVARCMRSMGRYDEALAIQTRLKAELGEAGESDGFIDEELGELALATGRADDARAHFAQAHALLLEIGWLVRSEPERLARIARLAAGEADS